jgi:hypothetical protein
MNLWKIGRECCSRLVIGWNIRCTIQEGVYSGSEWALREVRGNSLGHERGFYRWKDHPAFALFLEARSRIMALVPTLSG